MSESQLNSAGRVARIFVDSKLTPLFVVAVLLLGTFAGLITPREENPQILVPGAQVAFYLPGATPTEIEHLIIAPMEAVVREIEGVDHTSTIATAGMGQIQVQFHVGVDKDQAITRFSQRIAANRHRLPATTLDPVIQQIDVDNVAIVTVTLASNTYDDYALRRLAERMAERLNTIEQVSVAELHGGRKREIRVNLDPARLQAYGLTLNDGVAMISASNVSAIVGQLVDGGRNQTVYLKGQLNSLEEVRHLPLQVHKGQLIYLDDIAEVVDGPATERDQITRFSFGPGDPRHGNASTSGEMASVTLSVAKKPNTNAVAVSRKILAMVAKMQAQFVPADVSVVTTRNDGRDADHTVNSLIFDLTIAISSVLLVLVPFLGIRQAMIVCLVVPLVLGLTLAVDMLLGVTINRISLFALILALGMLVDDAIVVMENIHRHYEMGNDDRSAVAVLATNEIGKPTTIATITIILVFASLNILSGMNGAFFHPIAFNVPVAIGASLVVAYVVVPWACNRWLHQGQGAPAEAKHEPDALHRLYYRLITPLLDRARLRMSLFGMVAVALLACFLMPAWQFIRPSGVGGPLSAGGVSLAIMPKENRNSFSIAITMPEHTPIETTDRVARQFGEILGRHPLVSNYQTHVGIPGVVDFTGLVTGAANRRGPHVADIRVNLVDKTQRQTKSVPIVEELRAATAEIRTRYPGMSVRFLESPPGPPSAAIVLASIHGNDANTLRAISGRVKQQFEETYGVVDVFSSEAADVEQVNIVVDREKALLSGVTVADIEQTVRALMDGLVVSEAHIEGERNPVPIRLRVPREREIDPLLLDRITVRNRSGDAIPLSELTQVVTTTVEHPILRRDNEQVSYIGGDVSAVTAPVYAILAMDARLDGQEVAGVTLRTDNITLSAVSPNTLDGYQLLWDGELRLTLDALREMGAVLGVVLLLIFLLLVASYRSFLIPLLGMTAIPLGLIGIFPGHWLVGIPFSMTSMIGVVALAGVVIRNSLLIIDFIHDYQRQGHPLREAVKLAGAVRLRPILLTSTAVILGTLVMYRDPLFAGMATSLIFGTMTSTLLTLLVLPPLYYRVALHFPEWGIH
ncbi:efflux RND transporter permease subunit [Nevskia ramosa]|uniref:efflux RND transporter permease subunit n=2 Tax=Nevskia TaxID=64001 RepID=UPI003D096B1D